MRTFAERWGLTRRAALPPILARRLRTTEREIEDLALRDVPGRLGSLLLRLAEEYREPHERGIRLSFRLTHQDLAHMVGSTRETATMIMNRFPG
jgi:CRP/FNR family transcriptional regulator